MGNDAYEQTRAVIDRVRDILHANGFTIQDVVRTRMFVTNIAKWDEYARAHQEAFEKVRPASSIVQVERLVDPRLLVELEVDAVGGCSSVRNVQLPPWQGMTK
jgi:enamine deaminase RidA (YjgF/YER057c/UK114 family)